MASPVSPLPPRIKIFPLHTDMPQLSCKEVRGSGGPRQLSRVGSSRASSHQFAEGVHDVDPVVLRRVVAEDGPGEATAHVDQIVEGHGCDAALGDGDAGPEQPRV